MQLNKTTQTRAGARDPAFLSRCPTFVSQDKVQLNAKRYMGIET